MIYKIEYFIPATREIKQEEIEAQSEEEILQEILRFRKEIVLIKIKKKSILESIFQRSAKFSLQELSDFSYFLGKSLEIGLDILVALEDYKEEVKSKKIRAILDSIITDITNGKSLSESFAKHSLFPPVMISMLRVGEETGNIHETLLNYAKYVDWLIALRRSIKKALTYPMVVIFFMSITFTVMIVFVLPKIVKALNAMQLKEIPLPTQILIWLSQNGIVVVYVIIAITLLIFALIVAKRLNPTIRYYYDKYLLRLPIFGNLIFLRHISEDFKTIRDMYKAGSSMVESLILVTNTVETNSYLQGTFRKIVQNIERGTDLSQALEDAGIFPRMVLRTIKIGEVSGNIDEALSRIIEIYESDIKLSVERMTILIEPILQAVIGIFLALIAAGIMMPVYNIITTMTR